MSDTSKGVRRGSRVKRGLGYDFVHAAVDDRSRLAYAEILPDERKESASSFMARALGTFAERGITVERVLTDNGSCYRSRAPRGRIQPPAHSPVPATDQREGRALQPDR